MENKKRKRTHQEEGRDRLTNLPEDILLHILSFLDTKHAIQTCLLVSKSWKSLWPSIPVIRIDYKSTRDPSFNNLVDNILSCRKYHSTRIREFHLEYASNAYPNAWDTDQLLLERILTYASSNNVQVFNLSLLPKHRYSFPSLPAMFTSITTLKLEFVNFELHKDSLTGGVTSFPALNCLHLRGCFFSVPGTNVCQLYLLSGFPSLKFFRLVNCRFYGLKVVTVTVNGPELLDLDLDRPSLLGPNIELQVVAPKVERLSFRDSDSITFLQPYLPSVVQAQISLLISRRDRRYVKGSPYLIKLFQSLSNAEYVMIDTLDTWALSSTLDKLGNQPPPFPRLKYLKLVNLYPHTSLPLDVERYLLNGAENVRLEITRTY